MEVNHHFDHKQWCPAFYSKLSKCYIVEPHYNKDIGTMKITLLYHVSWYIGYKQRNIKSWDQRNYLVIRGFCYTVETLYNKILGTGKFCSLYQIICYVISRQKAIQNKVNQFTGTGENSLLYQVFVISDLFIVSFLYIWILYFEVPFNLLVWLFSSHFHVFMCRATKRFSGWWCW